MSVYWNPFTVEELRSILERCDTQDASWKEAKNKKELIDICSSKLTKEDARKWSEILKGSRRNTGKSKSDQIKIESCQTQKPVRTTETRPPPRGAEDHRVTSMHRDDPNSPHNIRDPLSASIAARRAFSAAKAFRKPPTGISRTIFAVSSSDEPQSEDTAEPPICENKVNANIVNPRRPGESKDDVEFDASARDQRKLRRPSVIEIAERNCHTSLRIIANRNSFTSPTPPLDEEAFYQNTPDVREMLGRQSVENSAMSRCTPLLRVDDYSDSKFAVEWPSRNTGSKVYLPSDTFEHVLEDGEGKGTIDAPKRSAISREGAWIEKYQQDSAVSAPTVRFSMSPKPDVPKPEIYGVNSAAPVGRQPSRDSDTRKALPPIKLADTNNLHDRGFYEPSDGLMIETPLLKSRYSEVILPIPDLTVTSPSAQPSLPLPLGVPCIDIASIPSRKSVFLTGGVSLATSGTDLLSQARETSKPRIDSPIKSLHSKIEKTSTSVYTPIYSNSLSKKRASNPPKSPELLDFTKVYAARREGYSRATPFSGLSRTTTPAIRERKAVVENSTAGRFSKAMRSAFLSFIFATIIVLSTGMLRNLWNFDRPFCDGVATSSACNSCPTHGICHDGKLSCEMFHRPVRTLKGSWICQNVKSKIQKHSEKLLKNTVAWLERSELERICGKSEDSKFTLEEILEELNIVENLFDPKNNEVHIEDLDTQQGITELHSTIQAILHTHHHSLGIVKEGNKFRSVFGTGKATSCPSSEGNAQYISGTSVITSILGIAVASKLLQKKRRDAKCEAAVRQIIDQNTTIAEGVGLGPDTQYITQIMNSKYNIKIDRHAVESICQDLCRGNAPIIRSVTLDNVIPFYFSTHKIVPDN